MASFDKPLRSFKANPNENAGINLGDDWVSIVGKDQKNFLTVNDKGIGMGGKVNMQTMTHDVKVGGIASLNMFPLLFTPSTTTTPISALTVSLPFEAIGELITTAFSLTSLLG